MWYNRDDAMKRKGDVRRLVESVRVRWLDCSLSCAHVAVLMSLSWWFMSLPFGLAPDQGRIIVEIFSQFYCRKVLTFVWNRVMIYV